MRRRWWWIIGAGVIIGLPIAWYLGSPLFINRTVSEDFPIPATPVALARGTFVGADNFHRGEGTVTIYRTGNDLVLRLDPFKVTNGPDLHVILTRHPKPASRHDVGGDYFELGKLKGNLGSQNYAVPPGVRLEEYKAVVIYCEPFQVVFATATLGPVP